MCLGNCGPPGQVEGQGDNIDVVIEARDSVGVIDGVDGDVDGVLGTTWIQSCAQGRKQSQQSGSHGEIAGFGLDF